MKFKGWDWTELIYIWEKDTSTRFMGIWGTLSEEQQARYIRKKISSLWVDPSNVDKKKIKQCRQFVLKIAKNSGYDKHLIKSLAEIKDDFTFTQYLHKLLECLWT